MNRRILFTILVIVVILILGYSFFWTKSGFIKQRLKTQPINTTTETSALDQNDETNISGIYQNVKYGFEFQYPKSWGKVEFGEAFASDSRYTYVNGIEKPDTGGKFVGNFIGSVNCGFGGITTNYTYGSEGGLFDAPGWGEENGRYYSLWPDETIRDSKLEYVSDFIPNDIVAISTGKALIINTKPSASTSENEYTRDYEVLRALINLPGSVFRGLAVVCWGSSEFPEVFPDDRKGFYQILSTFKFTN